MPNDAMRSGGNRVEQEYEWSEVDSVGTLVVETVAEFADEDPMELEALYSRVDTDALDALFRPVVEGPTRTGGEVVIPFDDYLVTVHADGRVVVRSQTVD